MVFQSRARAPPTSLWKNDLNLGKMNKKHHFSGQIVLQGKTQNHRGLAIEEKSAYDFFSRVSILTRFSSFTLDIENILNSSIKTHIGKAFHEKM